MGLYSPTVRKRQAEAAAEVGAFDFYQALQKVAEGATITRLEWLEIEPDCKARLTGEKLVIYTTDQWRPWIIGLGDMIGTDYITTE